MSKSTIKIKKPGASLLYAIFFLSGAAGLSFQICWSRMLAIGFGHEMPAVLAVVAAIFGGMSVGAWVSQRTAVGSARPGRCYGWLEIAIGVWVLATVRLIPMSNQVAPWLLGLEPSAWRQWFVSFVVPSVLLLPATAAMGATLPVMERFVAPLGPTGQCVGALYGANTLGAVAGVLASTFVALPALGYTDTLVIFALLSVLCGGVVLCLEPHLRLASPRPEMVPDAKEHPRRLGWQLILTGLLGIGYEVLGVRLLAQALENTIYTFAVVLAVYLLGTALGAVLYQRLLRGSDSRRLTSRLLLGLAVSSWLGVLILAQAPALYAVARATFGGALQATALAEMATAAAVFLFPTLAMGATFAHLAQRAGDLRFGLGRALALNTLGAAGAPVLFGVVLLPWLGGRWCFVVLTVGYAAWAWPLGRRLSWGVLLGLGLALSIPLDLRFAPVLPGDTLVAYREGVMESVSVVKHRDGNCSLIVNNRFTMGGTGAALAERRQATLPLLLHPNPQRALFLGLGTGITFASAGAHEHLRADAVELLPEIRQLLPWFEPQNVLPTDPDRFRIYTADARRFVQSAPARYDVIVADLFHPARDGAAALYAREHFSSIRDKLAPGGLFCQWLPLFQLDEPTLRIIVRTFLDVFPTARAYLLRLNTDAPVIGLIGGLDMPLYAPDYFDQRVRDNLLKDRAREEQFRDGYQLFGCFVAGPAALRRFSQTASLNTDDRPVVLFAAPAAHTADTSPPAERLLRFLKDCTSDPAELIDARTPAGADFARELSSFVRARDLYLHGLAAQELGREAAAVDAFVESARVSPQFTLGYAQCVTLALRQFKANPEASRRLLQRLVDAQPACPTATELLRRLGAQK